MLLLALDTSAGASVAVIAAPGSAPGSAADSAEPGIAAPGASSHYLQVRGLGPKVGPSDSPATGPASGVGLAATSGPDSGEASIATPHATTYQAQDPVVLSSAQTPAHNTHAEWLAPAVQQALAEAGVNGSDLTGVVVGVGPGPFTGLRVGIAAAEALSIGWGLPLHGVCSLDALALRTVETTDLTGEFLVATDARRREVYWAQYHHDDGDSQLIQGPFVGSADGLPTAPTVGIGVELYPEDLALPTEAPAAAAAWVPHASELGILAAGALTGELAGVLCEPRPLYLRPSDATVPAQLRGSVGA